MAVFGRAAARVADFDSFKGLQRVWLSFLQPQAFFGGDITLDPAPGRGPRMASYQEWYAHLGRCDTGFGQEGVVALLAGPVARLANHRVQSDSWQRMLEVRSAKKAEAASSGQIARREVSGPGPAMAPEEE